MREGSMSGVRATTIVVSVLLLHLSHATNVVAQGGGQWFNQQFKKGTGEGGNQGGGERRQAIFSEMQSLRTSIENLTNTGRLAEAETTARRSIARAVELTSPDGPPVGGFHVALA